MNKVMNLTFNINILLYKLRNCYYNMILLRAFVMTIYKARTRAKPGPDRLVYIYYID